MSNNTNGSEGLLARILDETGATHVKDILFDKVRGVWIIEYKTDLPADEFEFFNELYEYLNNG